MQEELEPSYPVSVSYETYEEQLDENRRLQSQYEDTDFKLQELISAVKETLESINLDEKLGELYEWCRENKYF